jgi:uncharacterized membrane protein YjgN (DUF898 family)
MHLMNLLLAVCTLGFYRFWGKTRVRRYLLSQIEFAGERFSYHGSGRALCRDWSKVALLLGVPLVLLRVGQALLVTQPILQGILAILPSLLLLMFTPLAKVKMRHYRLSQTSWGGIGFSFRGQAADFIKLSLQGTLLIGLTLGLYAPMVATRRYAFLVAHTYFGNQPCHFTGQEQDLWRRYVLALLLLLPTFGLSWLWYMAERQRYYWNHTAIATARFYYAATSLQLCRLYLTNTLLLLLTVGLAWSWVKVRTLQFLCQHLRLEGSLDLEAIRQELPTPALLSV